MNHLKHDGFRCDYDQLFDYHSLSQPPMHSSLLRGIRERYYCIIQLQNDKYLSLNVTIKITKEKEITWASVFRRFLAISLREFNKGSNPGRICPNSKALQNEIMTKFFTITMLMMHWVIRINHNCCLKVKKWAHTPRSTWKFGWWIFPGKHSKS